MVTATGSGSGASVGCAMRFEPSFLCEERQRSVRSVASVMTPGVLEVSPCDAPLNPERVNAAAREAHGTRRGVPRLHRSLRTPAGRGSVRTSFATRRSRSTTGGGFFPGSRYSRHVPPTGWPRQRADVSASSRATRIASPGATVFPLAGGLTSWIRVPITATRWRRDRVDAKRAAGPRHHHRWEQRRAGRDGGVLRTRRAPAVGASKPACERVAEPQ